MSTKTLKSIFELSEMVSDLSDEKKEKPRIIKSRKVALEPNDPDITMCSCRCISYCSCDYDRGGIIS